MAKAQSMYNTPPTFSIYVAGLVYEWIKSQGGVSAIEAENEKKSTLLHNAIDESPICTGRVTDNSMRSRMNVVFRLHQRGDSTPDAELESRFLKEAADAGFMGVKGHRSIGGLRVSLYNAITLEHVSKFVQLLHTFQDGV